MSAIQQILAAFGAAPPATDPNFSDVHALLHFAALTDSSGFGRSVAYAAGGDTNTFLDTTKFKFGPSSLAALSGFGVLVDNATLPALSGDFTIEQWVNFGSGAPGTRRLYFSCASSGLELTIESGGNLGFRFPGLSIVTEAAINRANNAWHHVAMTRNGTNVRLWVGGASRISSTDAGGPTSITLTGSDFAVGSGYPFDTGAGWVDDFRLTVGVCRYTSTFTPPTGPFPNS